MPSGSTYRRFWFRDTCLILNALLGLGQTGKVSAVLEDFPSRQRLDGYFHSQEGEWDANGQVLWIADRWETATGSQVSDRVWQSLQKGADWIDRNCLSAADSRHDGLLPAGFSAEHLGPNDHFYWDDLWALGGLKAAIAMAVRRGDDDLAKKWQEHAKKLQAAVEKSFGQVPETTRAQGLPASPYRRMDAGAIGTMAGEYPLMLDELGRENFVQTAKWLVDRCTFDGGFFQDMIHSGVNAYLTLALAQTLLRDGDSTYEELINAVSELASPTGQWPEAIHPRTKGGCMGDGQHAWAAAEWVLMMRALFVREEPDRLVVGAGLPSRWFDDDEVHLMSYGPTPTRWGPVQVSVSRRDAAAPWRYEIIGDWRDQRPTLDVRVPAFEPVPEAADAGPLERTA